ncbi:MAG: cyclic nucleotide-binding domain-containing protein [Anaerolineales bacterium]
MEIKETINSIALLNGMSDEQVAALEEFTQIVDFKKEERLFQVGHEAKFVYILLDGKVSIQVQLSSRPENMSIVVLQKYGQLVGWSGLMGGAHYTANGVCLEDSSLLKIEGQKLMDVLEQNPQTGFIVMREISKVISMRLRNLQSVVLKTI